MKLKEWGWDSGQYEEVEYPDEICKGFIDYFRTAKQSRESPEIIYNRCLKFERDLTDARNDAALAAAKSKAEVVEAAGMVA